MKHKVKLLSSNMAGFLLILTPPHTPQLFIATLEELSGNQTSQSTIEARSSHFIEREAASQRHSVTPHNLSVRDSDDPKLIHNSSQCVSHLIMC
jgi:hypothetical protein